MQARAERERDSAKPPAVLSVLPILTIFLVCQRWVVRAVVMSGLKG